MLTGEKVRIRKIERGDLPLLHKWQNDEDLTVWARFMPDHMVSLAALEKEYEKELAGEEENRTTYVIEDRASAKPIGWCILRTWDRKHVNADLGLALGEKEYWGRGFGRETMQLLLTLVFDHQGWHRAEVWTMAENERMVGLAKKFGFREEGHEREAVYFGGKYRDIVSMGLLKSEWDARPR